MKTRICPPLPLPNFPKLPNFHSPSLKKRGGLETMYIHLKIYEIIMLLLLFTLVDMVFCKDFLTFL